MYRRIGTVIGIAVIIALGLGYLNNSHVFAQDGNGVGDCGDPFAGVNVRFSLRYWPDTDFCQSSIDFSEVLSGGPPPDGIPPIDNPNYEDIAAASSWLADESPVVVVTIDGVTRAYPLAVMTWHEIVNAEQGGLPITVTFCPLCNSAIVFDRNVDGQVLDFGVSGNLRNSDLIMYDRQTSSWWQQFTGEGIVGEFTGTNLTMLPSQIIGFGQFAAEFPEAEVLSRDTGHSRSYGRNPYAGYDSGEPFLMLGDVDRRLPSTSRVLAGFVGSQSTAYPMAFLSEEGVINDVVDDIPVVALWQSGTLSALDAGSIDASRDIGTAALYRTTLEDGTVLTFTTDADGTITDEQTSSEWNAFGRATSGELEGTQLRQIIAGTHFWFAWAAFQPESLVYGLE